VPIPATTVDHLLAEGDEVTLGAHRFAIWHLPGHDEAHIVLISVDDGVMLGGDVLFPGGHGRTDIPGSDQATMERSLARLLELPDTVVVYPGHGAPTTIGQERGWMSAMTLD
jgi:glyoxylase-like metal-dependent hydrolase (beta-lactamase superfamily II)